MSRWSLLLCSVALCAGRLESVAHAAGIPIIWGQGETITEMGQLPPEARAEVAKELGKEVSVGYLYSHFHIYYADLWTWGGKHVLVHDKQYWDVDDDEWRRLLGEPVDSKFGEPWLYRLPVGLTLITVAVVLYSVIPRLFPSREKRLQKLFGDARYKKALDNVFPESDRAFSTTVDPQRLQMAVSLLMAEGISEKKARQNLEMMTSEVILQRATHIASMLDAAQDRMVNGEPLDGIELLEPLIAGLPSTDPRYQDAVALLAHLREEAAAAAEEGQTETSIQPVECEYCNTSVTPNADGTCPHCQSKIAPDQSA